MHPTNKTEADTDEVIDKVVKQFACTGKFKRGRLPIIPL